MLETMRPSNMPFDPTIALPRLWLGRSLAGQRVMRTERRLPPLALLRSRRLPNPTWDRGPR
jgi:hypothetical protein